MSASILKVEWHEDTPEEPGVTAAALLHEELWRSYFADAERLGCTADQCRDYANLMTQEST